MGYWKDFKKEQKKNKQERDSKIERYRAENRSNPTRSENKFRRLLESIKHKYDLRWTTQKVWSRRNGGFYLIDFFVHAPYKIAFEIDGSSHDDKWQYDAERDNEMMCGGLLVVRILNEELDDDYQRIVRLVEESLNSRLELSRRLIEQRDSRDKQRAARLANHKQKMREAHARKMRLIE